MTTLFRPTNLQRLFYFCFPLADVIWVKDWQYLRSLVIMPALCTVLQNCYRAGFEFYDGLTIANKWKFKCWEETQLGATECFIALIICSTCFGHLHAHHQELETILVLLPLMVCNALVAGGRLLGAEQQAMRPGWGKLSHNLPHSGRIACCPAPNSRPPATKALHVICSNKTSIVSSSWWWAYKCPKHVEQIKSAIKHSVESSWFSSLRLYYDARTNIGLIHTSFMFQKEEDTRVTTFIFHRNIWIWPLSVSSLSDDNFLDKKFLGNVGIPVSCLNRMSNHET